MAIIRVGEDFDSFDTLHAIKTHLEVHSDYLTVHMRGGRRYQRYVGSLLLHLLVHHEDRRRFLENGGRISTIVDNDGIVQKLVDE